MLTPGTKLGPHEILSPIGTGGMGEVYKARDARLDRLVAVKVLGAHLGEDKAAMARFEREAKAAAAALRPRSSIRGEGGECTGRDSRIWHLWQNREKISASTLRRT